MGGYVLGCLTGAADETALNVVYNIADFVNKIGFVLSCWSCAKSDSEKGHALCLECLSWDFRGEVTWTGWSDSVFCRLHLCSVNIPALGRFSRFRCCSNVCMLWHTQLNFQR